MNKVLVKLYVPVMEVQYDILLPINKTIYNIIKLLVKAINELSDGYYIPKEMPSLYNRMTGNQYDVNLKLKDTDIRHATEIILI